MISYCTKENLAQIVIDKVRNTGYECSPSYRLDPGTVDPTEKHPGLILENGPR
jgi:hypothetical protein